MAIRKMYHTQEKRRDRLTVPRPTINPDAWLGEGLYFWYYEQDAIWWGITAKKRTGYYEVYKADINCENVLDTVFNEEHYLLWIKYIDAAIKKWVKNERGKISLKYINDFLKEKGAFEDVDGVMFQDISDNLDYWIIEKFQYKKRIQIGIYNTLIISNFVFEFEGQCV